MLEAGSGPEPLSSAAAVLHRAIWYATSNASPSVKMISSDNDCNTTVSTAIYSSNDSYSQSDLACRQTFFIDNCLKSVNSVVKFVARNGVYFSRMYPPIGRSAQFCSVLFKVSLHDLGGVNRRLAWQLYNRDLYRHKDDINVICELLAVKHGDRVIWS